MNDVDREALAEQYADSENLTARARLYETYEAAALADEHLADGPLEIQRSMGLLVGQTEEESGR